MKQKLLTSLHTSGKSYTRTESLHHPVALFYLLLKIINVLERKDEIYNRVSKSREGFKGSSQIITICAQWTLHDEINNGC